MSYPVCVINEPEISMECANEIFTATCYECDGKTINDLFSEDVGNVISKGKLHFNIDRLGHIDYLRSYADKVLPILCKYKVKGDIGFAKINGDSNQLWCYRFDGNGKYEILGGKVVWGPPMEGYFSGVAA